MRSQDFSARICTYSGHHMVVWNWIYAVNGFHKYQRSIFKSAFVVDGAAYIPQVRRIRQNWRQSRLTTYSHGAHFVWPIGHVNVVHEHKTYDGVAQHLPDRKCVRSIWSWSARPIASTKAIYWRACVWFRWVLWLSDIKQFVEVLLVSLHSRRKLMGDLESGHENELSCRFFVRRILFNEIF